MIGGRALRYLWWLCDQGVLDEGECCRHLQLERMDFRAMCDRFRAEAEDSVLV